jgi:hypothetical protein
LSKPSTKPQEPKSPAPPGTPTGLDARITQTIKTLVNREERKSKFFFIRRLPARRIPREWVRPPEDEYKRLLLQEGFIADTLLEKSMSTNLDADVRELEENMLPYFWRVNQLARFYQNRYYQYQWAFILSAFFTTAFAAVNVYFYAQGWDKNTVVGRVQTTELLGLLTAVISGIAAAVSFLDANQTPQRRWFKARAQAENLRSLYFLFLARAKPFDLTEDRERVHRMRQKVIDVLRETPSSPTKLAPTAGAAEKPRSRPEGGL